ncbi:MAG TPA: hydrogenase 3 maturation endopeptidase HyCI [Methanocorpusculum sp.]|nr:hydrogenase 3 maturation endopeptidase HyCI [Methanocorpusculum sp.]
MSVIFFGVGNALHSDDGAGPFLAHLLEGGTVSAFDCGTAPENFTGIVRRKRPDTLVIADAALMGCRPGEVRRIPADKIHDTAVGTHMMSLAFLAEYLKEDAGEIIFLGIEPLSLADGEGLSDAVCSAVLSLKDAVLSCNFSGILPL